MVYLASDASRFTTGAELRVDGVRFSFHDDVQTSAARQLGAPRRDIRSSEGPGWTVEVKLLLALQRTSASLSTRIDNIRVIVGDEVTGVDGFTSNF